MNGLFITGTDTGVGKTRLTTTLARSLRRQGRAVTVCKPVATGAELVGQNWVSADTRRLAAAAGMTAGHDSWMRVTRWTFPESVAPPVAAARHGVQLNLEQLSAAVRATLSPPALALIEGVGGLLCPLTETETVADLVQALDVPVLVVARRGLGTLNHTLLTLEVARARGLAVAGVIVNEIEPPTSLADRLNVDELRKRMAVPLLVVLPFDPRPDGADADLDEQTAAVLAVVPWERLARRTTTVDAQ